MRQIGEISNGKDARRFADYLLSQGITTKLEEHAGVWSVWVHEEDQVDRARAELTRFEQSPQAEIYADAGRAADEVRADQARREAAYRKQYVNVGQQWSGGYRPTRVTTLLIVTSIALTFLTDFGSNEFFFNLTISSWFDYALLGVQFHEVLSGQVWRLFTPMFVHLSVIHLLFNMMWLYDLGRMAESYLGWWRYALLVGVTELAGSIPQYVMTGPQFGGMSGVVYGLFGYIWMKQVFQPSAGLRLTPNTALLMLIWFVACASGMVGDVANWAHGGGLIAGMVIGAVPTWIRNFRREWKDR